MSFSVGAEAIEVADAVMSSEEMYRLGLEASISQDDGELNLITAHKWFNLAAMQGNLEARAYRAELAQQMTTEQVAEAQRQAREFLSTHRAKLNA